MRPVDPERIGEHVRERTAGVRAPQTLRAQVAEARLRSRPAPSRGARAAAVAGAAAVLAAVVIALVVLVPGSGESVPTLPDAAAAGLRAPTAPAPARRDARTLDLAVGDVAFPAGTPGAWRPVGTRTDRLGGRTATTVLYAGGGRLVSYTIVDGAPLGVPADARSARYDGVAAAVLRRDGATIVTWRRGGRTCILASRNAGAAEMLDLAARS